MNSQRADASLPDVEATGHGVSSTCGLGLFLHFSAWRLIVKKMAIWPMTPIPMSAPVIPNGTWSLDGLSGWCSKTPSSVKLDAVEWGSSERNGPSINGATTVPREYMKCWLEINGPASFRQMSIIHAIWAGSKIPIPNPDIPPAMCSASSELAWGSKAMEMATGASAHIEPV